MHFLGKYYPLEGMDEETRAQVEDHFFFKKGYRFLEQAGINISGRKGDEHSLTAAMVQPFEGPEPSSVCLIIVCVRV